MLGQLNARNDLMGPLGGHVFIGLGDDPERLAASAAIAFS